MAADHAALVRGLERDGPDVLREHLRESAAALVAAAERDAGRRGPCRRPVRPVRGGESAPGRETGGAPDGSMSPAPAARETPSLSAFRTRSAVLVWRSVAILAGPLVILEETR